MRLRLFLTTPPSTHRRSGTLTLGPTFTGSHLALKCHLFTGWIFSTPMTRQRRPSPGFVPQNAQFVTGSARTPLTGTPVFSHSLIHF